MLKVLILINFFLLKFYFNFFGLNWFLRKIIESAKCTRVFIERSNNTFQLKIITGNNNANWDNITIDKPFKTPYMDDEIHIVK